MRGVSSGQAKLGQFLAELDYTRQLFQFCRIRYSNRLIAEVKHDPRKMAVFAALIRTPELLNRSTWFCGCRRSGPPPHYADEDIVVGCNLAINDFLRTADVGRGMCFIADEFER